MEDYDLWEQTVRTTLKAKNKLSFIDGSLMKLEVEETYSAKANARHIVNYVTSAWILNVSGPKLCIVITYVDTTNKVQSRRTFKNDTQYPMSLEFIN